MHLHGSKHQESLSEQVPAGIKQSAVPATQYSRPSNNLLWIVVPPIRRGRNANRPSCDSENWSDQIQGRVGELEGGKEGEEEKGEEEILEAFLCAGLFQLCTVREVHLNSFVHQLPCSAGQGRQSEEMNHPQRLHQL